MSTQVSPPPRPVGRGRGRGRTVESKYFHKGVLGRLQPKKISERASVSSDEKERLGDVTLQSEVKDQKELVVKEVDSTVEQFSRDDAPVFTSAPVLTTSPVGMSAPILTSASVLTNVRSTPIPLSAVHVDEFVPSADRAPSSPTSEYLELEDEAMTYFSDALLSLSEEPGIYDELIESVICQLSFIRRGETTQTVVDMIFEQAIYDYNFRYSGAKLVSEIMEAPVLQSTGSSFTVLFFKRCQCEFGEIVQAVKEQKSEGEVMKAICLVMFFGEVLCTLTDTSVFPASQRREKAKGVFKGQLFKVCSLILEKPTNELLTCMTNLLKLVGPFLDKDKPKDVQDMFDQVRDFKVDTKRSGQFDQRVTSAMFSVYKLHTRDWDRHLTPASKTPVYHEPYVMSDMAKKLLAEKQKKLPTDWSQFYDGNDEFLDEDSSSNANLNAEEMDAYEIFLKDSGQL